MDEQKVSVSKVITDIRSILRVVMEFEDNGNPILLSDLKERFEGKTALEFKETVSFLEKYGYLILNRSNNEFFITKDGRYIAHGDKASTLTENILKHFKDQVQTSIKVTKDKEKVIDGKYRKYAILGSGGLATVYKGEIVSIERDVAIKEFKGLFRYFTEVEKKVILERLEEVIKKGAKLYHPNIVQILDLNINSEAPYFVMEYVQGGNLKRLLSQNRPLSPSVIVSYLLQLLYALRLAHELGVFHRNIKPENILIDLHGNLKFSDFSLNTIVERDVATIKQVFIGTGGIAYLSPEYFQDPKKVDKRSDIYSLGILLYEMCTKRIPGRRSPMPSEKNPELPKGLDEIFDKMTQDIPEERYQDVNEIIEDIYKHEDIVSCIDKKSAILMYKSPCWDLGLPIALEIKEETKEESKEGEVTFKESENPEELKAIEGLEKKSETVVVSKESAKIKEETEIEEVVKVETQVDFSKEVTSLETYPEPKESTLDTKEVSELLSITPSIEGYKEKPIEGESTDEKYDTTKGIDFEETTQVESITSEDIEKAKTQSPLLGKTPSITESLKSRTYPTESFFSRIKKDTKK